MVSVERVEPGEAATPIDRPVIERPLSINTSTCSGRRQRVLDDNQLSYWGLAQVGLCRSTGRRLIVPLAAWPQEKPVGSSGRELLMRIAHSL